MGSLVIKGHGTVGAANTFTGGTTIDSGTLDLVAGAGGSGPINFASGSIGDALQLNNASVWETVNGSNGVVGLTNARASVVGGADTIDFVRSTGNAARLYSTSGNWDLVNGSNGTVILNRAQTTVAGSDNAITFTGTSAATLNGGSDALPFQHGIGGQGTSTASARRSRCTSAHWTSPAGPCCRASPSMPPTLSH